MFGGSFPEPREFQHAAHESLRQGARDGHRCQMLMAPTGAGKCLDPETPVIKSNGDIVPARRIRPGDRLLGPDGKARNVISVSRGRELMYRVTPKKGDSYVVNASHILSLRKTPGSDGLVLSDGTRIDKNADVVNVNVEVFYNSSKTAKHCLKGWRSDAVDFESANDVLAIPPYILGAWLGDGMSHALGLCKPLHTGLMQAWIAFGNEHGLRVVVEDADKTAPIVFLRADERCEKGYGKNSVWNLFVYLDLKQNKHIPYAYLTAGQKQRAELLAGLIDSDGSVSNNGFDFLSKHRHLSNQVAFLARSLGLAAYVSECQKSCGDFVGTYWRVSISGDCDRIPCLDKKAGPRLQKKRHLVHGITVEPIGEGDYFGFEIDGDHLFLLGDFTVTHNTYLGLRIAHEANKKGKRAIFMCDRQALINQTYSTAQDYGMSDIGVIMGQDWQRSNPKALLQIASAQTIQRRKWPDADVIIIDEAHTQMPAWVDHIPNTEAMVIGLSATPFSPGLGKLFSNLINATTMAKLTEQKVLVPMRVITCVKPDMVGAATSGSEWTAKAAGERGMEIVGNVVLEWKKHSENRKTIVFGSDIKHCEALCQEFNEAGVMACLYTSKTTDAERREILKEFRKADSMIRVLISVEALAKGFDVQDVGVVVDCRPLRKSLSTAIQMWGRGARSSSISEKNDFILIDHSGNFQRFAEDFENIYFNGLNSLDEKDKLDGKVRDDDEAKEPKSCPACGYSPFFKTCMSCGHEKVTVNTTEHEDGVGVEIKTALTAKTPKDDKAERQAFYSQLIGYQQECGYSPGWSAHKYKEKFGVFPRGLTETPIMPSAEMARWIKSRQIRFAKGKEKRERLTGATA